jgi:heme-degrading monooxygenase HmoA
LGQAGHFGVAPGNALRTQAEESWLSKEWSSMIEVVWEFVVKEDARGQFELAYGPGGAWSKLFARYPGFRGTTLLRDTQNPRRYVTIDLWDTEAQREQMRSERKAEYSSLDAAFGDWTDSRTEVGIFRALAEATVHPIGRARRNKPGESRRRSRGTTR